MTSDDPRAQSEQSGVPILQRIESLLEALRFSSDWEHWQNTRAELVLAVSAIADSIERRDAEIARLKTEVASGFNGELRAENTTLQAELAMATDAANKGDDARTKAGAMQDQISDLRNIIAGMFWAGGSIDDKTMGDIRALGLDCRAENEALAKLLKLVHDDLLLRAYPGDGEGRGRSVNLSSTIWNRLVEALRAGQQKGEHHG